MLSRAHCRPSSNLIPRPPSVTSFASDVRARRGCNFDIAEWLTSRVGRVGLFANAEASLRDGVVPILVSLLNPKAYSVSSETICRLKDLQTSTGSRAWVGQHHWKNGSTPRCPKPVFFPQTINRVFPTRATTADLVPVADARSQHRCRQMRPFRDCLSCPSTQESAVHHKPGPDIHFSTSSPPPRSLLPRTT